MKIVIRYGKKNEYLIEKVDSLKKKYPTIELIIDDENSSLNLKNVDLLITNRITREELQTSNKLKYLIIPFTGVNTLPLKELHDLGIKLVNSHVNARYVAEKAITLSLALLGKVVMLDQNLRKGNWKESTWNSLYDMKCGIIGMGEIGKRIISHLEPFDCQIITLERYRNKDLNYQYYSSVEEVCLHSDLIFVSLPLTNETKNILNKDILSKMQDKYIINVGRGDTIHEEGLYEALKNNVLKGAGLDVWYQYPQNGQDVFPSKYPFHELPNVVLSPHCGGNVLRCRNEEVDGFIRKLEDFIEGREVKNVINLSKEY